MDTKATSISVPCHRQRRLSPGFPVVLMLLAFSRLGDVSEEWCRSGPKLIFPLRMLFRIRGLYHASDTNSNSGKIWAITTAYPSRLFADTQFRVKISTDKSARLLLLKPPGKKTRVHGSPSTHWKNHCSTPFCPEGKSEENSHALLIVDIWVRNTYSLPIAFQKSLCFLVVNNSRWCRFSVQLK